MSNLAQTLPRMHWTYASDKPVLRPLLLLAVILHALLLLIPSREFERTPARPALNVTIDRPALPVSAPPARPEQPVRVEPEPPRAEIPEPAQPLAIAPPQTPPPRTEPAPRPRPSTPVTTALLLEQARQQDLDRTVPITRIPGVPDVPDLPHNLSRRVLPLAFNAFDDYVISGEQEILDQWMEPGGVINAVVKLPNGEVVCGRAEPWDEMNPLYEPVAMYRSCGGGGRRTAAARSPFSVRE
jgi:hypothetical protein